MLAQLRRDGNSPHSVMGKAIYTQPRLWVKTGRCVESERTRATREKESRVLRAVYRAALPSPPDNLTDVRMHGVDELWGVKA